MKVLIGEYPDDDSEQIIDIVIEPHDTFSMDATLARIVTPMLKQLKASKQGCPSSMPYLEYSSNSSQSSFDFYREDDDAAFTAASNHWDIIMDKMIFAFEHIVDTDWEDGFKTGVIDWIDTPVYDASGKILAYSMDKGSLDTYTCDYEGIARTNEKIEEGLLLFGEYYRSLWD